eukprot:4792731-Amphidinium_carterae.1
MRQFQTKKDKFRHIPTKNAKRGWNVLPHFQTETALDSAGTSGIDVGSARAAVEAVLASHGAKRAQKPQYMPQFWVLRAVDHALYVSRGVGLSDFIPTVICAEDSTTTRVFVEERTDSSTGFVEGQVLRWWKATRDDEQTVRLIGEAPVTLHVVTDQGTVGWQLQFYLQSCAHMSLTWRADVHHRVVNDVRAAVHMTGLQGVMCACTALFNLSTGPWRNASYSNSIQAAWREYMSAESMHGELFEMHFEELASESEQSCVYGSEDHYRSLWDKLGSCRLLRSPGARTARSRWFAFFDRCDEFIEGWTCLLLILTFLCIQKGYVQRYEDMPLVKNKSVEEVILHGVDVCASKDGEEADGEEAG